MEKKVLFLLMISSLVFLQNCVNHSEEDIEDTLIVSDFLAFVQENLEQGFSIGMIAASTNVGILNFSLLSQTPQGAIELNTSTGEITVNDASLFEFDTNQQVVGEIEVTDSLTSKIISFEINIVDDEGPSFTIWTGPTISFTKSNGADPNSESNQDRITDNVWITRGNTGGQIFNIRTENSADKTNSPTDTEWAEGTTANIQNLTFRKFRDTVRPKSIVGKDLVVHLISDDIYIDIKFTSWTSNKRGGFSYERSSQ